MQMHSAQAALGFLFLLGNFYAFGIVCWLFQKNLSGTLSESNGLNPDQNVRHFDCPDVGPNSLQMLSADDKSRC